MTILRSLEAIAQSTGDGPIDWRAASRAAKAAIDPGSLSLGQHEIEQYRTDVRDARRGIRSTSGIDFDIPSSIEVQNRHHWIDSNIDTFSRVMRPIEKRWQSVFPQTSRVINTGSVALMLAFLGKHVLGQYDPILLADSREEHELYFVHPNITDVANELEVDRNRFRRWIAFHEVAHAAEFGAAPWLPNHLEQRLERGLDELARGSIDRQAFQELDATMTAVEGYAEILMDNAFDQEYDDLRDKLDERRRRGGPIAHFVNRFFGLGIKRRQYERGRRFFDTVVNERDIETAAMVWKKPDNLPTPDELDAPREWLKRVLEDQGQ